MIGDRATAALVGADTAIDWYCPSRFDAAAACFRLVDPDGGAIAFELDGAHSPGEQHYVGNGATPVLRTTLQSGDATIEVSDHLSDDRLVRIVKVLRGPATVVLRVEPGWRFGRPRKVERWSRGISFGPLTVEGLAPDESVVLDTGEFAVVTLGDPLDAPFTLAAALDHQRRVIEAWQPAMAEIPYDGPFRDGVVAAARTIRMLTDRSTGAVLSSCTTSLPVQLGNERSVDQRLAWVRENAAIVWLWERLGLATWADETRAWLAERAGDELPLAPAYRSSGERVPTEIELMLAGWRGSGPVRVSNRAGDGLDLGGMAALTLVLDARRSWRELDRVGSWLAEHWSLPDAGRWDSRGRPQQWVASKLGVHRALTALARTAAKLYPLDLTVLAWADANTDLGNWLRAHGRFGTTPHAGWSRTPRDDSSDAAALAWAFASEPPGLPNDNEDEAHLRMIVSLDQTLAQLTDWPFLHRHLPHVDDGFPPGQGPDLLASFHAVSALCRLSRWEDAHRRMEALVAWIGPLGMVPTHADPDTGDFRGNVPSAAASSALITAALDLQHGPR